MTWLSDASWAGLSGMVAFITLGIMLFDRKNRGRSDTFRTFLKMGGFFLLGAFYAPVLMTVAGLTGDLLTLLGAKPIGGFLGDLSLRLSRVQIGYWAFNQNQGLLSLQLSALMLWLGGACAGMAGVLAGYLVEYDMDRVDRVWLIIPFFSIVLTMLIGAINAAT